MGLRCGFFLWTFETKPSLSMKASLAFKRYAVSAETLEAVLVVQQILPQPGAITGGGIRRFPFPDQPELPVDGDV
jgi:hypothetical protein